MVQCGRESIPRPAKFPFRRCRSGVLRNRVGNEDPILVDAGPTGLGLILQQKKPKGWQPVVCASRSLTEVEQRYSQTEKLWTFDGHANDVTHIVIGSTCTVETDHKPLLPLFNQPHSRPPMRIERWLLYLQQFDFELKYIPGKENPADYLSRHPVPLCPLDKKVCQLREEVVHRVV